MIVSREPVQVRSTRIFARHLGERQLLTYQMHLDTRDPAAMILPIPIAAGAGEDAVVFRDLSPLPELFELLALVLRPRTAVLASRPRAPLAVHRVGSFVTSFVPTRADFARLDRQFRLSEAVWQQLPGYDDWGFVVFQFEAGAHTVHPMAFEFPSRFPEWLYFPTVHVHDGMVHEEAHFDHELYFQGFERVSYREQLFGSGLPGFAVPRYRGEVGEWPRDVPKLRKFLDIAGISDELPLLRLALQGQLPNEDTWLREAPAGG